MEEQQKITFEKVYEILKEEKRKEELSSLEESFYSQISDYIKEKKDFILSNDEMSQKQFLNFKRMVTELFERREAKLMRLSILSSRLRSNFIDKSKFLNHEHLVFNSIREKLKENRIEILEKVLNADYIGSINQLNDEKITASLSEKDIVSTNVNGQVLLDNDSLDVKESKAKDLKKEVSSLGLSSESNQSSNQLVGQSGSTIITFTKEVSKFVGENMEIFGPYKKDEVVSLPKKIADILIKREQAIFNG